MRMSKASSASKPKKMGRPPMPAARRKDGVITVRLAAADLKRIERAAAQSNTTLAAWCRSTLLGSVSVSEVQS